MLCEQESSSALVNTDLEMSSASEAGTLKIRDDRNGSEAAAVAQDVLVLLFDRYDPPPLLPAAPPLRRSCK